MASKSGGRIISPNQPGVNSHLRSSPQANPEAIVALLSQKNIEEAARSIGIGSATLLGWLKDSDFDTAHREARRAAFRQSVARLQQASGAAVTTLVYSQKPTCPEFNGLRA